MRLQSILLLAVALYAGCSSDSNEPRRRGGAPMLTQVSEINGAIGKRVTIIGTARRVDSGNARIEIRSGYVDLPGYQWPKSFVDQRVEVIGTVVEKSDKPDTRGKPVYRMGEIESVSRWSR